MGRKPYALLLFAVVTTYVARVEATAVAILRPVPRSASLTEAQFRLQGELLAVGADVTLAERPTTSPAAGGDARERLESLAAARRLDAILDIIGDERPLAVDVWIFRRASGQSEVSRVVVDQAAPDPAKALAIRAIEVLRSNFLDLDLPPDERPAGPPLPRQDSDPTRDTPSLTSKTLGLEAGAAVLAGLGGVGPSVSPLLHVEWAATSRLGVHATLSALGTRPTIENAAGSVRVGRSYGLVGLCYCPRSTRGLEPLFALSTGALHTTLDGSAEAPNRGHHVSEWSLLFDAGLGARLALSNDYRLTAAAHLQIAQPYVAIHVVDTVVARAENPELLLTLTLGAWL